MKSLLFAILFIASSCKVTDEVVTNREPVCAETKSNGCLPNVPDLKLEMQLRRIVPTKLKLRIDGKTLFDQCITASYDIRRTKITKDSVRSIVRVYHYDFNQAHRDIKIELIDRGDGCNQSISVINQDGLFLNNRTIGSDLVYEGFVYE